MYPQNNKPLDKGRATKWPSNQQGGSESVEIELDTMPINHQGPLRLYIFLDSENQQDQSQGQAPQYQGQAPQYQEQNNYPQHAPQQPVPQQQYGRQRQ